jgi:hypothetical protein
LATILMTGSPASLDELLNRRNERRHPNQLAK